MSELKHPSEGAVRIACPKCSSREVRRLTLSERMSLPETVTQPLLCGRCRTVFVPPGNLGVRAVAISVCGLLGILTFFRAVVPDGMQLFEDGLSPRRVFRFLFDVFGVIVIGYFCAIAIRGGKTRVIGEFEAPEDQNGSR